MIVLAGPSTTETIKGLQRYKIGSGVRCQLLPMFRSESKPGQFGSIPSILQGPFRLASTMDASIQEPTIFTPRQVLNAVKHLETIGEPGYMDYTVILNRETAGLRWDKRGPAAGHRGAKDVDLFDMNKRRSDGEILQMFRDVIASAPKP